MAAAFGLLAQVAPGTAITIEIDDVAPDRVERQRAFAEGQLPLAGTPDLGQLDDRLKAVGVGVGAAMFIRVFKAESELEVWMRKGDRFVLFATYPICHWAGTIGPKLREGDKQNPEGFYSVGPRQLHRIGRWPRALNIGFPNTFDRAHGRTGSYILVHGGCSSVGCFAMTNAVMSEIFSLTEAALKAGQDSVRMHVFPFRMTEENLEAHATSPWLDFWRNLKEGYDAFEQTRVPPRIGICDRRYVVEAQRPGEVGSDGPLALCGVSRAALIEPSSLSLAPLPSPRVASLLQRLPALEQPPTAMATGGAASETTARVPTAGAEPRSAWSGLPLPPLPSLSEQAALNPPPGRRPRNPLANARARRPAPSCNVGLASCRKFLALRSRIEAQGMAVTARGGAARLPAGRGRSRALGRLTQKGAGDVRHAVQ